MKMAMIVRLEFHMSISGASRCDRLLPVRRKYMLTAKLAIPIRTENAIKLLCNIKTGLSFYIRHSCITDTVR